MRLFIFIVLFFTLNAAANATCEIEPKFSYRTKSLTVEFKDKSEGNYDDVKWTFGDGNTSTKNNPKHQYAEPGMYNFSLTIYNDEGCSETFEGKVYIFETNNVTPAIDVKDTESVAEEPINLLANNTLQNNITNYPNPFNEATTIAFNLANPAQVAISIHDITGRLVAILADEKMEAGPQEILFKRNHLVAGTYIVNVNTSKAILTRKIIIQ